MNRQRLLLSFALAYAGTGIYSSMARAADTVLSAETWNAMSPVERARSFNQIEEQLGNATSEEKLSLLLDRAHFYGLDIAKDRGYGRTDLDRELGLMEKDLAEATKLAAKIGKTLPTSRVEQIKQTGYQRAIDYALANLGTTYYFVSDNQTFLKGRETIVDLSVRSGIPIPWDEMDKREVELRKKHFLSSFAHLKERADVILNEKITDGRQSPAKYYHEVISELDELLSSVEGEHERNRVNELRDRVAEKWLESSVRTSLAQDVDEHTLFRIHRAFQQTPRLSTNEELVSWIDAAKEVAHRMMISDRLQKGSEFAFSGDVQGLRVQTEVAKMIARKQGIELEPYGLALLGDIAACCAKAKEVDPSALSYAKALNTGAHDDKISLVDLKPTGLQLITDLQKCCGVHTDERVLRYARGKFGFVYKDSPAWERFRSSIHKR